jgi:hypothetical protein
VILDGTAALGFAPHSGWAAVIGLGARGGELRILIRERIDVAAPRDAEAKQPYHTVEGLPMGEARERLARYETAAAKMASSAMRRILDRIRDDRQRLVGVGILDSSGRRAGSLEATLRSHALIHTADGDHCRSAIAAAAAQAGLPVCRVRTRDLEAEAAAVTGRDPEALRQEVGDLGRTAGPPWGGDQKAAALLAWLLLVRGSA